MNFSFLYNRYIHNRRIVNGYKYQFEPFGGGQMNELYWDPIILRQGDTFVDIGANVGGWTIPAARYYRRIVAFEANQKVAEVLSRNLRLNHVENVEVLPSLSVKRQARKCSGSISRLDRTLSSE